jgi:ADP-ribose pyrophosphatase YjhB (NUDIX family)
MTERGLNRYIDPVSAVGFIIRNYHNSKITLVRRKDDPFDGMLSIHDRFMNEGEIVQEEVMRTDAKKEASMIVKLIAIADGYSQPKTEPLIYGISVALLTKLVQRNKEGDEDAAALRWVNITSESHRLTQSNERAFEAQKVLTNTSWMKKTQLGYIDKSSITFWPSKKQETEESLDVKSTEG